VVETKWERLVEFLDRGRYLGNLWAAAIFLSAHFGGGFWPLAFIKQKINVEKVINFFH